MKNLEQFYDAVRSAAAARFDRSSEHFPTFFVETEKSDVLVIPTLWSGQSEKEATILAVREVCATVRAVRVVVVLEAWMVARPVGTATDGITPSQETDREEVLWVLAQGKGETDKVGYYKIVRTAPDKATVGEYLAADPVGHASIFDGIVGGGVLQ